MARPDLSKVPGFYHNYINQVPENDLFEGIRNQSPVCIDFFEQIPADKVDHAYAPGKWTIREMLQHIIDAERIFTYRALRFARKDATPLPGFDENDYAASANAGQRKWTDLLAEFKAVRKSTEYLFYSFNADQLEATGVSNNNSITVVAIGYICVGHALHHINVIRERYL